MSHYKWRKYCTHGTCDHVGMKRQPFDQSDSFNYDNLSDWLIFPVKMSRSQSVIGHHSDILSGYPKIKLSVLETGESYSMTHYYTQVDQIV